ncbi:hypothetical protein I3760_07G152900 [Carya illinoinensis]|nr:hypothetical protein I3760_07G152900 [Carya illinoinensis]
MDEEHGNSIGSSSSNLETAKAERSVWLMKCPVAVAKSWKSHPQSDPHPLAKVVLSLDPLHPDGSSFLQVAMEGKVEHKFDMKPHGENIEEYGKLCRERTSKSMIKSRQIQVIDNDRGIHMRPMPGMVGLISSTSKDKKKTVPVKQSDVKRTRRDRGELEDIMFKLFERQPNWALKQLVQETDQPAQFLKEILNELCVYNKRGTNQGTYELKPEYKKVVEDTTAE